MKRPKKRKAFDAASLHKWGSGARKRAVRTYCKRLGIDRVPFSFFMFPREGRGRGGVTE